MQVLIRCPSPLSTEQSLLPLRTTIWHQPPAQRRAENHTRSSWAAHAVLTRKTRAHSECSKPWRRRRKDGACQHILQYSSEAMFDNWANVCSFDNMAWKQCKQIPFLVRILIIFNHVRTAHLFYSITQHVCCIKCIAFCHLPPTLLSPARVCTH